MFHVRMVSGVCFNGLSVSLLTVGTFARKCREPIGKPARVSTRAAWEKQPGSENIDRGFPKHDHFRRVAGEPLVTGVGNDGFRIDRDLFPAEQGSQGANLSGGAALMGTPPASGVRADPSIADED
jgi:hypothetical protein